MPGWKGGEETKEESQGSNGQRRRREKRQEGKEGKEGRKEGRETYIQLDLDETKVFSFLCKQQGRGGESGRFA